MRTAHPLCPAPGDRLRFLAETVLAAAAMPRFTHRRLFAVPMDLKPASTVRNDVDLARHVDAVASGFGRRQDTLGGKPLPASPEWLNMPMRSTIDKPARATTRPQGGDL